MKIKFFIFPLLLVSCLTLTRFDNILHKQGIIDTQKSWGGCVYLNNQFILTASHVLDSEKFTVHFKEEADSNVNIVYQHNDITLLKTHLNISDPPLIQGKVDVNEEVYWVQTIINQNGIVQIWLKGNVAFVDDSTIVVDRQFYPGASGSGLYDSFGQLVGICSRYMVYDNGLSLGVAEIPKFPLFIQQKINGDLK